MNPLSEVRWGIIGVGDVCEVKSAPAMQQLPHSRVVAVMRRQAAKAASYAQRHGVARWYDEAEALLQDPEVNAIYIATPPDSHAPYALRAAALGKPVYVEKPMARTHAECQQMVAAFAAAGLPLFVAYYRRALPMFLSIREHIAAGAIGAVRSVRILMQKPLQPDLIAASETPWRVQPAIAGGGYFYDLASHQLDFLDYLFGPVVEVGGTAANQAGQYPAEDIVSGYFRHASGVIGQGLWCFSAPEALACEETIITGSQGEIRYPTFGAATYQLTRAGQGTQTVDAGPLPPHIQAPLIAQVVAALRGTGSCPSTGETAARTSWVMEQMVYGGKNGHLSA